jgi:hypothetical protein
MRRRFSPPLRQRNVGARRARSAPHLRAVARATTCATDITGLLVFDGHAFCQFVEGGERVMRCAARAPRKATRATAACACSQFGPLAGARRFPIWRLGYAYSADPSAIARMRNDFDAAAVAAFERWATGLTHRGDDDDPASGILRLFGCSALCVRVDVAFGP